jgi:hypothetical protein
MNYKRILRALFDTQCRECQEVRIPFWRIRCSFCDVGDGQIK